MADCDRAADDGVDTQHIERDADADDVDDRVERANLVDLDVVCVHAVGLTFDLGKRAVDRQCPASNTIGGIGCRDQLEHLAGRSVNVMGSCPAHSSTSR